MLAFISSHSSTPAARSTPHAPSQTSGSSCCDAQRPSYQFLHNVHGHKCLPYKRSLYFSYFKFILQIFYYTTVKFKVQLCSVLKKFTYAELTGSLLLYRANLYFTSLFTSLYVFHLRPGKIKNREQYLPVFMPVFYKAAIVSRFITAQQNLFYNYNRYFGIVYNMVAYTAKQQSLMPERPLEPITIIPAPDFSAALKIIQADSQPGIHILLQRNRRYVL